jgi:hypothetical protein
VVAACVHAASATSGGTAWSLMCQLLPKRRVRSKEKSLARRSRWCCPSSLAQSSGGVSVATGSGKPTICLENWGSVQLEHNRRGKCLDRSCLRMQSCCSGSGSGCRSILSALTRRHMFFDNLPCSRSQYLPPAFLVKAGHANQ